MRTRTLLRDVKDVELVGLSHYIDQCVWGWSWVQMVEGAGNKEQIWTLFPLCGMSWKTWSNKSQWWKHKAAQGWDCVRRYQPRWMAVRTKGILQSKGNPSRWTLDPHHLYCLLKYIAPEFAWFHSAPTAFLSSTGLFQSSFKRTVSYLLAQVNQHITSVTPCSLKGKPFERVVWILCLHFSFYFLEFLPVRVPLPTCHQNLIS